MPPKPEKAKKANVYADIAADIFFARFKPGSKRVDFERRGWVEDAAEMAVAVVRASDAAVIAAISGPVVFEGAQGLLLDQDRGWFPHVTRSNTGVKNAAALAQEAGIDALDITYCARAYLTRHGAGPLPGELAGPPHAGVADATNVPGKWQGALRFARLDLGLLAGAVRADLKDAPAGMDVRHGLRVSCLDQIGRDAAAWRDEHGGERRGTAEALAVGAAEAAGACFLGVGHGPARSDAMPVFGDRRR